MGRDNRSLDALDREILGVLMAEGRLSYRDLGARVGLSANAAADRVRRLVRAGAIRGFTAVLDPSTAGRPVEALVDVRLDRGTDSDAFGRGVARLDTVLVAQHVTGRFDWHMRLACRDTAELDRVLRTLKRELGAVDTETRIVLRTAADRRPGP
ncbi:MAG TPA: Lrp/AsnC family transcriptional regulator [Solirubrobacteraceae bacterium]|nr:Lrp/AsnC family transcriptional regulator [Solirubrobacteraceae bacterium]